VVSSRKIIHWGDDKNDSRSETLMTWGSFRDNSRNNNNADTTKNTFSASIFALLSPPGKQNDNILIHHILTDHVRMSNPATAPIATAVQSHIQLQCHWGCRSLWMSSILPLIHVLPSLPFFSKTDNGKFKLTTPLLHIMVVVEGSWPCRLYPLFKR